MQQNGEGIQHLEGVSSFHDNELHWYRKFRGIDNDRDKNFLSSLIGTNAQGHTVLCADKLTESNMLLWIPPKFSKHLFACKKQVPQKKETTE